MLGNAEGHEPTPSVAATRKITACPSVVATPCVAAGPSTVATPSLTAGPSVVATPSVVVTPSVATTPSVVETPSAFGDHLDEEVRYLNSVLRRYIRFFNLFLPFLRILSFGAPRQQHYSLANSNVCRCLMWILE